MYLGAIRGSASYFTKYTSHILSMISGLGCPTLFMTISYNDLKSFDSVTAIWKSKYGPDAELDRLPCDIPFGERQSLLNENPIPAARHFAHRMNVIMRYLRRESLYLFGATLADYSYRIEFQSRGSPHAHMLLWLDGVPDYNTEEGIAFIDRNISCSLDVPYKAMVMEYPNHHHTDTCFKRHSNCRFGYP